MYQAKDLDRLSRSLVSEIEDELTRVGFFFRIFYRVKEGLSLINKINRKGRDYYDGKNKFVSDIIGIRIVLYFSDDVEVVYSFLRSHFLIIEETIDKNEETKFAPTRLNLIVQIPESSNKEFYDIVQMKEVSPTFEIQLRTILSEGWHEVDHDLRYKCQSDWIENMDLSRSFNGILATLETSECSILRLFDQLSYRHYKEKNFDAMLRTKFRIRLISYQVSPELNNLIDEEFIKQIFKVDRIEVLKHLFSIKLVIPITMDNLIYIINEKFIQNSSISKSMPFEMKRELRSI